MSRYTEGIAFDGTVILEDGEPISISEIIERLNRLPSKRKLESYSRAEKVCRELRYQWGKPGQDNYNHAGKLLTDWMSVTGKIKYERPI